MELIPVRRSIAFDRVKGSTETKRNEIGSTKCRKSKGPRQAERFRLSPASFGRYSDTDDGPRFRWAETWPVRTARSRRVGTN
jgi:hypothetical protein